jgi:hypothetical protein
VSDRSLDIAVHLAFHMGASNDAGIIERARLSRCASVSHLDIARRRCARDDPGAWLQ